MANRMSSSEGSRWGGSRACFADIIDLDRYMRGGVRPSRTLPGDDETCKQQLVVDSGRAPRGYSSSDSAASKRHKRYSHDSGLSDTYTAKSRRPHRRTSGGRAAQETSSRAFAGSSSSLRAFRTTCEQTLREQQQQIARVAQLCELLAERKKSGVKASVEPSIKTTTGRIEARAEPRAKPRLVPRPKQPETSDSSDTTSSSGSANNDHRKEKHRSQQCKTYKIIMTKLDELNKLFHSRGNSPRSRPAARRPAPPESSTVTVSDKVVATEAYPKKRNSEIITSAIKPQPNTRCVEVNAPWMVERGVGDSKPVGLERDRAGMVSSNGTRGRSLERGVNEMSERTHILNIAPRDLKDEISASFIHNVTKFESSHTECLSSVIDIRSSYDFHDTMHLYSEAKQALHVSSRRARSAAGERADGDTSGVTLCALCRGYWRSLRHYLAEQIFNYPEKVT